MIFYSASVPPGYKGGVTTTHIMLIFFDNIFDQHYYKKLLEDPMRTKYEKLLQEKRNMKWNIINTRNKEWNTCTGCCHICSHSKYCILDEPRYSLEQKIRQVSHDLEILEWRHPLTHPETTEKEKMKLISLKAQKKVLNEKYQMMKKECTHGGIE